ncbi:MAG: hypothetical protein HPY90_15115 [Syntrophothermus sp.]|uniref:hypothetical protein n=1 Tax=Syntrophothermus sp. TaxID=2736299 RepID=UPI00257B0D4E|nr:hypothetical protein [Syntrophothermus sp.]NSW84535.1 hypothetical protein [Syntrophothermus sp.]
MVLVINGVMFAGRKVVAALGITTDKEKKEILVLWEGAPLDVAFWNTCPRKPRVGEQKVEPSPGGKRLLWGPDGTKQDAGFAKAIAAPKTSMMVKTA